MSQYKCLVSLVVILELNININCDIENKTQRVINLGDNKTKIDKGTDAYEVDNELNNTTTENVAILVEVQDVGVSTDREQNAICPYYKPNKIDINKMVDVWQTVYYQAAEKVPCFKILIRKLNISERKLNAKKYGLFNNKILWDNCTLEIKADTTGRKHFLQETADNNGVLQNIIIETGNKTQLIDEIPDQWFIQKNLLLMKDCYNGDVVVFARVPFTPSKNVIAEALKTVGDNNHGRWTCEDSTLANDKDTEFEIFGDITEFM